MKITYNAPFTLTYTFLAVAVMFAGDATFGAITRKFFTLHPGFDFSNPLSYVRLVTHVIGHDSWEKHLIPNFTYILLIGPILEEKYGSQQLFFIALTTALITGILNIAFSPSYLLGGSGIVFMMILLGSFANFRSGTIPLTFILVLALYTSMELYKMFYEENNISEFSHIVGGICGSVFGFLQQGKE